ncbi:LpqN/LpqT family lipoprotein [Mycobacterium sp. ENV421]|uniref:LpqN/LpqT family lipoprotein n=1 Tax=unclassified Mycobacterium TaxID=2642494 RepID=UPI001E307209|nr:LpqN/LpqT family lipoprotein [Mycobacterium sp. ENV421]
MLLRGALFLVAAMRFDEFVIQQAIEVIPVDQYPDCAVQVALPPGWEPYESAAGLAVWVCRSDPRADEFCPNAVLTMHRVEAVLDCGEVFMMLAEQQLQSVPGCHERSRELTAAVEGSGIAGTLAMEFAHEFGPLDSICRSRIVASEDKTLIVQLTTSALRDSPVVREPIRLTVRTSLTEMEPEADDGSR